jgi:hypothetical protein
LVSLILDNRVQGHIDQVNKLLECGDRCVFPPFPNFLASLLLATYEGADLHFSGQRECGNIRPSISGILSSNPFTKLCPTELGERDGRFPFVPAT